MLAIFISPELEAVVTGQSTRLIPLWLNRYRSIWIRTTIYVLKILITITINRI